MPAEADQSPPPPVHEPHHTNVRPKGILKNPSFSGQGGLSPDKEVVETPPSIPLDPRESKDLTLQNTLQNAGGRRSSSAARRASTSRRHSSALGMNSSSEEEQNQMRLKWDEANLYLAEQEAGGRMKITEPKTPFEYGNTAMDEEDEEDVGIDPRFVNVDEVEMAEKKNGRKGRESDIPGLELGEAEDMNAGAGLEDDRIVSERGTHGSLSRESSKDKHVSVGGGEGMPGMPTQEEMEKHRIFEEQRKRHYEMRNVKDMLGHPETLDDEEDEDMSNAPVPNRGVNGNP
ncbi:hypothetical protein LTR70_008314 [Exophiala xenobiotica]|uniref:Glc8 protein n=1 Tax=Lithohypha guttulata TaxID=1690604 RepID=A0ABR0K330_9EURO|nr:hypothetical protein LTR24_007892 [Lithohypha guttulata]KAK5312217.1 hypothetical protein LTR70_008314 [Exophiala xenobiotica]